MLIGLNCNTQSETRDELPSPESKEFWIKHILEMRFHYKLLFGGMGIVWRDGRSHRHTTISELNSWSLLCKNGRNEGKEVKEVKEKVRTIPKTFSLDTQRGITF